MRHAARPIGLVVIALILGSGGTGTEAQAQYSRRTPIVEAVQKTRAGIVSVRVTLTDAVGRERERVGTGIVVDERGYIITSLHVVATTSNIRVHLLDGTTLTAQLLKEDPSCDLAILRIQPGKKLQALPLGPANDLLIGETVIAVGHPYGYNHTVSTGIVSAVGREITLPNGETLPNLIQTNASINPGNSGGPLLNINGELIGITGALREGAQGIAFAVNADTIREALCRQMSALEIAGVQHGLACAETVTPEGPRRQRVLVEEVDRQTPAAAAGLERGDEILRVAEHSVCSRFDVERALWDHKPGEQIRLTVVRQGQEKNVQLTLARASASEGLATSAAASTGSGKLVPTP